MTPLQIYAAVLLSEVIVLEALVLLRYSWRDRAARVQWERRKSSDIYNEILKGARR